MEFFGKEYSKMIHYLGEVVTLATGEIGVIEAIYLETDSYDILLDNGNIINCYGYEIL